MTDGKSILYITDAHADPEEPNDRFEWANRLIMEAKPDIIVDGGDFGTFGSLSGFEKRGGLQLEGQRYADDVAHVRDARRKLTRRILAHKTYSPRLVHLEGNHEHRITRAIEANPVELEGTISVHDPGAREMGWEYHKYLKEVNIDGITFCHHAKTRALGGKYAAHRILEWAGRNYVTGHIHSFQQARKTYGSVAATSITGPCYFSHYEHWLANQDQDQWDRGLLWFYGVKKGRRFGLEYQPFEEIERMFG